MQTKSLALLLALLPAALFSATPVVSPSPFAIPGGTQLTTFVIKNPGYYYVTGDRTMLNTSTDSILITCDDVTLDLGGYTLRNIGVSGTASGIRGTNVNNIEVRNGNISTMPNYGVNFDAFVDPGASNIRIVDVRVSLAHYGINLQNINSGLVDRCTVDHGGDGVHVSGNANVVSNCVVSLSDMAGIVAYGPGAIVRSCTISKAKWYGIIMDNCEAIDCQVSSCNLDKIADGAGIEMLQNGSVKNCIIRDCYVAAIYAKIGHFVVKGSQLAGTRTAAGAANGLAISATYADGLIAKDNEYSFGTGFVGNITPIGNSAF